MDAVTQSNGLKYQSMEHISNMGYSLDAIKFLVELQVAKWLPSVDIHYKETYSFRDKAAYKREIAEYRIKYKNSEDLNNILKQHLSTCEQIIKIWDERLELWDARSLLKAGREDEVDSSISYEIYCTLGGRDNNIRRFYGDILLFRYNNGKLEIGDPYIWNYTSWRECDPEARPKQDEYKKTFSAHLVPFARDIKRLLSEYVGEEEYKKQPNIPDDILNELKDAKLITIDPLKWVGSISLCAYFVDSYFAETNLNDLWKVGQTLFNVRNLAQSKNNYIGNQSGKPKGFKIIDEILEKYR